MAGGRGLFPAFEPALHLWRIYVEGDFGVVAVDQRQADVDLAGAGVVEGQTDGDTFMIGPGERILSSG